MRKRLAIIALGLMTLGLAASAAPASAGPVGVKRECGTINIYINGSPVINHVWCPSDS